MPMSSSDARRRHAIPWIVWIRSPGTSWRPSSLTVSGSAASASGTVPRLPHSCPPQSRTSGGCITRVSRLPWGPTPATLALPMGRACIAKWSSCNRPGCQRARCFRPPRSSLRRRPGWIKRLARLLRESGPTWLCSGPTPPATSTTPGKSNSSFGTARWIRAKTFCHSRRTEIPLVHRRVVVLGLALLSLRCAGTLGTATHSAPSAVPKAQAFTEANPFARPSALPYQAPPFDKIGNLDYQPAIEEGMRRQREEWNTIARQSSPPSFDNTIVALDRSGALLSRVNHAFNAVVGANTNDTLQQVQTEEAPKLAAHHDALYLDPLMFRRVEAVYQNRASMAPDQRRLVERYHRDFVRAGAQLSASDQDRLRKLNQEEATLSTDFQNKLLDATKNGALVVDSPTELQGLSTEEIAAAGQAAQERKLPGKYVIPLQNTTQQPAQVSLMNRSVRQRLFEASIHRADRGDSNDTRAIVRRLAQLRTERAQLLGFPTYAAYALDNQMAKTPDHAIGLLSQVVPPATR